MVEMELRRFCYFSKEVSLLDKVSRVSDGRTKGPNGDLGTLAFGASWYRLRQKKNNVLLDYNIWIKMQGKITE